MNISIDGITFEETKDFYPISDGLWYKQKWYKPIPQFKVGDWVTFYSGTQGKKIVDRIKEWTTHSYCRLEGGLEPFKNIIVKATFNEIWVHLQQVAVEKGLVKGAKVYKDWDGKSIVSIVQEDNIYYPETDEFAKSGIVLYRKGKWVEKVEPIFVSYDSINIYDMQNIFFIDNSGKICNTIAKKETYKSLGRLFSTQEKAQEYIDKHKPKYEILSFTNLSNKNILTKFDNGRFGIYYGEHSLENQLEKLDRGKKIHSIKNLETGEVLCLGDKAKNKINNTEFNIAEFQISPHSLIVKTDVFDAHLLHNIEKVNIKLTFGGHECTFKVESINAFNKTSNSKVVKVTCKGEQGTHYEIGEILKNYFRPCKFGNVEVKSFTWTNNFKNNEVEVVRPQNDLYTIDKIKIGCLTGTYKELQDIYDYCKNLLKWV